MDAAEQVIGGAYQIGALSATGAGASGSTARGDGWAGAAPPRCSHPAG